MSDKASSKRAKAAGDAGQPAAGAEAPAAADPAKVHLAAQWKYARPLTACRFDPSGRHVFTGAEDNLVQRWNLADETPTALAAHDSWIRGLAVSADGRTLYSGGYDGRLVWWPCGDEKPEPIRQIEAHHGWIRAVVASGDDRLVATCGNDNLVRIWDAADGRPVHALAAHDCHVYNLAFHPDGGSLVSCDLKGQLKHWDLASGRLVREFAAPALHKYDQTFRADIGGARGMGFSRDGAVLAVSGITNVTNAFAGVGNPAIVSIDWPSGKLLQQQGAKETVQGTMWGVAQHGDGYWIGLAADRSGGWLLFFRTGEQHEFFKFKLGSAGRDLSLSHDGISVAVAQADGNLAIYRLADKT